MATKLIFFDIDGTLLCHGEQCAYVPQDALLALERLRARGHELCIATGRALTISKCFMQDIGIDNAVLHNGAMLVRHGAALYEHPIAPRTGERLCKYLSGMDDQTVCYDGVNVLAHNPSPRFIRFIEQQTRCSEPILPLDERRMPMLSICTNHLGILGSQLLRGCEAVNWSGSMIDINVRGSTKAAGLKRMARLMDYSLRDTIAVGDAANDIQMLRAAGMGIAMGNAMPEVKAAADLVTDDIDQGGIYNAFERLALL